MSARDRVHTYTDYEKVITKLEKLSKLDKNTKSGYKLSIQMKIADEFKYFDIDVVYHFMTDKLDAMLNL